MNEQEAIAMANQIAAFRQREEDKRKNDGLYRVRGEVTRFDDGWTYVASDDGYTWRTVLVSFSNLSDPDADALEPGMRIEFWTNDSDEETECLPAS